MIRVAVIADTLSRARSLARLLADDEHLDIVEARAVSPGSALIRSRMVDVTVMAGFGPEEIPADGPPVVVLMEGPAQESILGHGIRAWLPLHSSAAEISAAIVAAANDLAVLTEEQVRRWLRRSEPNHPNNPLPIEALTARELQVLRMLADGLGNKEIAERLGISDHTAKFHVAQILAKLQAGSRAEAVALGIRRGLIPV